MLRRLDHPAPFSLRIRQTLRGTVLRDHVIATAKNLGLPTADMGSGLAQVP